MLTNKIHNPNTFLKEALERQVEEVKVELFEHPTKSLDELVKVNGHPILIEFKQEINPIH